MPEFNLDGFVKCCGFVNNKWTLASIADPGDSCHLIGGFDSNRDAIGCESWDGIWIVKQLSYETLKNSTTNTLTTKLIHKPHLHNKYLKISGKRYLLVTK